MATSLNDNLPEVLRRVRRYSLVGHKEQAACNITLQIS